MTEGLWKLQIDREVLQMTEGLWKLQIDRAVLQMTEGLWEGQRVSADPIMTAKAKLAGLLLNRAAQ